MSHVQDTINRILQMPTGDGVTYARAFRDSYIWDSDDNSEQPPDPDWVVEQNGPPLKSLCSVGALLDRAAALHYLTTDLNYQISQAAFDKRVTNSRFLTKIGREIALMQNRHVFTMAEIRCLFEYHATVKMPAELEKLFT